MSKTVLVGLIGAGIQLSKTPAMHEQEGQWTSSVIEWCRWGQGVAGGDWGCCGQSTAAGRRG